MRRTAAAIATGALAIVTIAGPLTPAAAQPTDEVTHLVCDSGGPAACDLVAQAQALLTPLQPVIDLVGPALGDLGGAIDAFGTASSLATSDAGVPATQLTGAAQGVVDELRAVGDPLLGLLGGNGTLGPITSVLDELLAALEALPGTATGQGSSTPTPASSPSTTEQPPARAANAGPATGFGGGLSSGSTDSTAPAPGSDRSGSDVPEVPVGDQLALAPLAPPDFASLVRSDPLAAADHVVEEVVLPAANQAAAEQALPDGSGAMTAVGVLSALLLVSGIALDQVRKRRHVIPD